MENDKNIAIESHPWQPFVPPHTKVLFLGTFPPKPSRWSMDFYYHYEEDLKLMADNGNVA